MTNMTLNVTGYDLYEVSQTQWVIDMRNGDAYHGSLKEVARYMVSRLGFQVNDITQGLEFLADDRLVEPNKNAVHFGMYKSFIFTFEKDLEIFKKAS